MPTVNDCQMRHLTRGFKQNRWIAAVAWGIAILVVSSLPPPDISSRGFPGCDKVLHFIEYLILGVALRYWAGGMGFAALDEFHQRYVPGREASYWDLLADVGGVLVGFFVSAGILVRKEANG
jgi:VanZ family protein